MEPKWYIHSNFIESGPFSKEDVIEIIESNKLANDSYVFREDWKRWAPIIETKEFSKYFSNQKLQNNSTEKIDRHERVTVKARVEIFREKHLVLTNTVDISKSGIFIETDRNILKQGEIVRLICRFNNSNDVVEAKAEVMRYIDQPTKVHGYGLRFSEIDTSVLNVIDRLVSKK